MLDSHLFIKQGVRLVVGVVGDSVVGCDEPGRYYLWSAFLPRISRLRLLLLSSFGQLFELQDLLLLRLSIGVAFLSEAGKLNLAVAESTSCIARSSP
jgi:hypothetical protein